MEPTRELAAPLPFPITHAFQPIVDLRSRVVHAFEALVRGPTGEPASWVFARTPPHLLARLDDVSRRTAIRTAAALQVGCRLNLNCSPSALESSSAALDGIVQTARSAGLALPRLVIELTENDAVRNPGGLRDTLDEARAHGISIAIDDFGAGHSGLNLLADFQPDEIKIDMNLVRGIDSRGPRQAIVRAVAQACSDLGIDVVAEGVETPAELAWLRTVGIDLYQGHLFARPGWRYLPEATFPG